MGPYGDAIWCNFNRGKRSLAVDFFHGEGQQSLQN